MLQINNQLEIPKVLDLFQILFGRLRFVNIQGFALCIWLKGTNGRQKTYEISHVYSIFYSGFMFQTTVIFGITKDGNLY